MAAIIHSLCLPTAAHALSWPVLVHVPCTSLRSHTKVMQLDDDDTDRAPDDLDDSFLDALESQLKLVARGPEGRARARLRASRDGLDDVRRKSGPLVPLTRTLRRLSAEAVGSLNEYSESPSQQLLLGSLALLVGFFVSHGQALGGGDQGGRWEYVSGGVAVFVVERITRGYYELPMAKRSPTLRLLHAFKVGFVYGCVLDALKLGG